MNCKRYCPLCVRPFLIVISLLFLLPIKGNEFEGQWHSCARALADGQSLPAYRPTLPQFNHFSYSDEAFKIPQPLVAAANRIIDSPIKDLTKISWLSRLNYATSPSPRRNSQTTYPAKAFNSALWQAMRETSPGLRDTFSEADEVAVVVHQHDRLQDLTANFLEQNLPALPTLLLASDNFPVLSGPLIGHATDLQWSNGGEFSTPLRATKFHMFGGFSGDCLSTAIRTIVEMRGYQVPTVEFYVHSSLVYEGFSPQRSLTGQLSSYGAFEPENVFNVHRILGRRSTEAIDVYAIETNYGPAYSFNFTMGDGSSETAFHVHVLPQ